MDRYYCKMQRKPLHRHQARTSLSTPLGLTCFIVTIFALNTDNKCNCDLIDPGHMFDDSLPAPDNKQDGVQASLPFPSNLALPTDSAWSSEDSSCSMGTGVVLKRIVRKLFNHVDRLQPNELDDEFIYQSSITYDDYLGMLKHLNDNRLNCASLLNLDTLLSNFMSAAEVTRPSQSNLFSSFFTFDSGSLRNIDSSGVSLVKVLQQWPNAYLTLIILIVCLVIWFLKNVAGYSEWTSNLLGILLPGFIQFYMQQHWLSMNNHQAKLEKCVNPSYSTRVMAFLGYDYDNCRGLFSESGSSPHLMASNVAIVGVEYLSELVFHPLTTLAAKVGHASQSYLSSFTGWNQILLAPVFLVIIHVGVVVVVVYLIYYIISYFSIARPRSPKTKQINSGNNAIATPKRKFIEHGGAHSSRKNKRSD